jgi:8-oxo-dGTP diphosphatase
VLVDTPTDPEVTEAAGGSTAEAGWFTSTDVGSLPLTETAADAVAHLTAGKSQQ